MRNSFTESRDIRPSMIFENFITKEQLAEATNLSLSFVNKLMQEEGLPYVKIGRAVRFRVSEVMGWLQQRRRP